MNKTMHISALQLSEVPQRTTCTAGGLQEQCENVLSFREGQQRRVLRARASACHTLLVNGLNSTEAVSFPLLTWKFPSGNFQIL